MRDEVFKIWEKYIGEKVIIVHKCNDEILTEEGTLDAQEGFANLSSGKIVWHGDILAIGERL